MGGEIKFRAWHEDAKEYCEGINSNIFRWVEDGQPVVIEQFTGIRDCNGVEIYEGDLVKFYEGWRIDIAEVRYSDIYGYWFANNCEGGRFKSCQVIGNIHQNPELLGGEQ